MRVELVFCVSPEHLGLVRSQLNEVTLTITRDVCLCVCFLECPAAVYVCACVCASSVPCCVCVCLCDWQAQTVCDVLINHIDSLLLR